MQCPEIEAPVESIGNCAEVWCGVFATVKSVVATAHTSLEIAEHGIDPLKLRHLLGLAPANRDRFLAASCRRDCGKKAQRIGMHDTASGQVGVRPSRNGLRAEPGDRRQLGAHRMTVIG